MSAHVPAPAERRYTSDDEDSARWDGFAFRDGDIVISTRSKSGTTWVQMICALLVLRDPGLPAPLADLSPWLDHLIEPVADVRARLDAQRHRRFIKTHTPLDGLPLDPRATYLVVARHPLDMAVSLHHQGANLDRARLAALTGHESGPPAAPQSPRDALLGWIHADRDPRSALDSLPGVLHHLGDAWARRDRPNVVLLHYTDLVSDLGAQMRGLAARLGLEAPGPELVEAAGFARMRARAATLAPDRARILKDPSAFFRRGGTGAGRELLTDAEYAGYLARAATLAPSGLLEWLHRPTG